MSRLILVLAILLSISASMMGTAAAPPSCNLVLDQLNPCVPYLMKQENNPESGCCNGVKYLQTYSADKGDRQAICECLESAAFAGFDYSLISSLPQQCGVPVKLPTIGSSNFDCSEA